MNPRGRIALVLAALIVGVGCGRVPSAGSASDDGWPDDPALAAQELFRIADDVDAAAERIDALFDRQPPRERAALFDALATLAEIEETQVVHVESLETLQRVAVDLTGDLPGGGSAEGSVQFARRDDGSLRAVWFSGPGVEWPTRARSGSGLSSSSPP